MGTAVTQADVSKLMAAVKELDGELPALIAGLIRSKADAATLEQEIREAGTEADALDEVAASLARHFYGVAKRALAELGAKARGIRPSEFVGRMLHALWRRLAEEDDLSWLETDPEAVNVPPAKPGTVAKAAASGLTTLAILKGAPGAEPGLEAMRILAFDCDAGFIAAHRRAKRENALPEGQQPGL